MKKKKIKRRERKRMENAERKIRLGYLSSDFGMGRTRDLLPAFFAAYNKLRFEIYAYHTGMGGDTALFSKEVTLRELGGAAPAEAAEIIRRDKIDLLVDLSLRMPDETICAIMEMHPAAHVISLADNCPRELAEVLPTVEGEVLLPYCYTPFDPAHRYTYRAPLLDTGVPAIGVSGSLYGDGAAALRQMLSDLLARMPAVRLIFPASIAEGLSAEDFAQLAELGTEESALDLVDELPYDEIDILLGIHVDLMDVCHAAEHGVPLLVA